LRFLVLRRRVEIPQLALTLQTPGMEPKLWQLRVGTSFADGRLQVSATQLSGPPAERLEMTLSAFVGKIADSRGDSLL
jgi:hypothetical protein